MNIAVRSKLMTTNYKYNTQFKNWESARYSDFANIFKKVRNSNIRIYIAI